MGRSEPPSPVVIPDMGQGRGEPTADRPRHAPHASPVVPTSSDAPADSTEKSKDKTNGQHDDADDPQDGELEQEAHDQQNYTEDDHDNPLGSDG
jgi:hypothetical protein